MSSMTTQRVDYHEDFLKFLTRKIVQPRTTIASKKWLEVWTKLSIFVRARTLTSKFSPGADHRSIWLPLSEKLGFSLAKNVGEIHTNANIPGRSWYIQPTEVTDLYFVTSVMDNDPNGAEAEFALVFCEGFDCISNNW